MWTCFLVHCVCVYIGWSDRDWLELNDRGVKYILPGVNTLAGKAPPPVAKPDVGPDVVVEARKPDVPILPKPPIKVRPAFLFNFSQQQLQNKNDFLICFIFIYSFLSHWKNTPTLNVTLTD